MKEKEILLSMFKTKMFYISIGLLVIAFGADALGLKIGVAAIDSDQSIGINAIKSMGFQIISMLKIIPPIFLMIGLLDIWVPRETMIKLMGEKSGIIGILIAFFIGTMSAGPLLAAFPVAQIMLKKGARYANVLFFITIWASAKIPIIFFQATTLGTGFTIISNITLITIYLIGTYGIEKIMSHEDKKSIYALAEAS